jgi:hypothetical protein
MGSSVNRAVDVALGADQLSKPAMRQWCNWEQSKKTKVKERSLRRFFYFY